MSLRRSLPVVLGLAVAVAASIPARADGTAEKFTRADLEIVDCLLPGQVRQLGNRTFLSPRRPTTTTAADCRLRGGEYVAFDRANLQTALRVWMDAAQAGDADAQNQVGEIYERGMGTAPDPAAAAEWYARAAAQGHARAQFNLGSLYEQGLGVERDRLHALNLYRQSWGLEEDALIYRSAAQREQQQLRAELTAQLETVRRQTAEKDTQLQVMQRQLERQQAELAQAAQQASDEAQAEVAVMKQLVASLEAQRETGRRELDAVQARVAQLPAAEQEGPLLRTPQGRAEPPPLSLQADARVLDGLNFGRYYALVIGNQDYRLMNPLQTPGRDAERAAAVLAERYGFSVQVLRDSSDVAMLKALNDLNARLTPEDNLLIYYAGHGVRLQTHRVQAGYWLPVNAEPPPKDTFWIPNEQITAHIARLPARRVLIVADSCYAGLLAPDPGYLFRDAQAAYSAEYLRYKLPKRARLLIASGGDAPVLDGGGDGHSVFARAFLDVLESNQGVMPSQQLFGRIRERVLASPAQGELTQTPEFKSIKGAGHEVGEFFFVPRAARGG